MNVSVFTENPFVLCVLWRNFSGWSDTQAIFSLHMNAAKKKEGKDLNNGSQYLFFLCMHEHVDKEILIFSKSKKMGQIN